MALVPAICTQCGARVEVDNSQEAAICKYCGTPFIVEKAINQYNTTVINDYAGATVNVAGFNVDNLLELAQISYDSKNYAAALENCDKVLTVDTKNYKAWELKAKCVGWVNSSIVSPKCYEALQISKRVIEYAPATEKQKIAGVLQTEVCIQAISLMNIFAGLPTIGRVSHEPQLVLFINTCLEALRLPYVHENVLDMNAELVKAKLSKPTGVDATLAACGLYVSIEEVQKKYNQEIPYPETVEEIRKQSKEKNEVEYLKLRPDVLADQKANLLPVLEKEYAEWEEIDKRHTALVEEINRIQTIVKAYQFKLFGEGAKIRKENESKLLPLFKELDEIKEQYNEKKVKAPSIKKKIDLLHSL